MHWHASFTSGPLVVFGHVADGAHRPLKPCVGLDLGLIVLRLLADALSAHHLLDEFVDPVGSEGAKLSICSSCMSFDEQPLLVAELRVVVVL